MAPDLGLLVSNGELNQPLYQSPSLGDSVTTMEKQAETEGVVIRNFIFVTLPLHCHAVSQLLCISNSSKQNKAESDFSVQL